GPPQDTQKVPEQKVPKGSPEEVDQQGKAFLVGESKVEWRNDVLMTSDKGKIKHSTDFQKICCVGNTTKTQ
ncbi:hypothetical protein L0F63_005181, partial [Massospora cicadina]